MTIDQLENLTIYEIRELARRSGIIPGVRRKSEIINDIIAVSQGKMSPATDKKHGRPPKSLGKADLFVSSPTQINWNAGNNLVLNQNTISFKYGDILEVTGYLEVTANGGGFLWENDNNHFNRYLVPPLVMDSLNLRPGDKLFASASATQEGAFVKEIFKINDVKADHQTKRLNFDKIAHTESAKSIQNNQNLNLAFGKTYFIVSQEGVSDSLALINLLNNCKADYKIYLNTMVADKNKNMLKNLNEQIEQFTVGITDSNQNARSIITLACERAKRIFEQGKSCIVAVDNLSGLIGVDESGMYARTLLNLTKSSEKGAITLLTLAEENKYTMPYNKIADKKFSIVNNKIV